MEGGEVKEEEKLPAGFRFHPTDEELITCYLMNKISDANFTGRAIGDVDLNKCEPWDLPGKAKMGEKEWYFFNLRDRKYPTGLRTNRATNTGYWKTTGKDKEIYNSDTSELVGMKKTLVFYGGRAPRGEKTNWVMHEYRIHSKSAFRNSKQDEWVVCRVFQKSVGAKKHPSPNQSSSIRPAAINLCTTNNNLDQFPQNPIPSQHMIHHPLDIINSFQFPAAIRSHLTPSEIQELSRALMISSSSISSGMTNLTNPSPQPNYGDVGPGGGNGIFTISGLDLNLAAWQPLARAAAPPPPPEAPPPGGGYGGGMNDGTGVSNNRFMVMEQCSGDLEHYWPSY